MSHPGAGTQRPPPPAELPDAWPDRLDFRRWADLKTFLSKIILQRLKPVELPEGLPLRVPLPRYLLLEFHNLPNGNYSRKITHGYSTGFDRVMLGEMRRGRAALARELGGCKRVLDAGCGYGASTDAIAQAGVAEVVGLDASPYLLQHAARRYPQLHFLQGLAERTDLPAASFDGINVCFLLHEMPPSYVARALVEFNRLLMPHGQLAILEPAAAQYGQSLWRLLLRYGWRGAYFGFLSRFVYEPYVSAWHQTDVAGLLRNAGFELIRDQPCFPSRLIRARKVAECSGATPSAA